MQKNELKQTDESLIMPVMRYPDIAAAIDWLCATFGFEKHLVVTDEDGEIFYAQLSYGTGMIMIGSGQNFELDPVLRQPQDIGGDETQCCYLVIDDVDAHYARTKAAGAEIVLDIKGGGSGGQGYSCRDPYGHIWNFGAYNPWKGSSQKSPPEAQKQIWTRTPPWTNALAFVSGMVLFAGLGTFALWASGLDANSLDGLFLHQTKLAVVTPGLKSSDLPESVRPKAAILNAKETRELREALKREKQIRLEAEQQRNDLREALEQAQKENNNAELTVRKFAQDLEQERKDMQELSRTVSALREELQAERQSRQSIIDVETRLQNELEAARAARAAAFAERAAALKAAEEAQQSSLKKTMTLETQLRDAEFKLQQAQEQIEKLKKRKRKVVKSKRKRKKIAKKPKKKKAPKPSPPPSMFGL